MVVRKKILLLCAPCLLCIVAGVQRYLAFSEDFGSWKGAGFGMFASIEAPKSRVIGVTLVQQDGQEIPWIFPPQWERRRRELVLWPSESRLNSFAHDLASLHSEPVSKVRIQVWQYHFDSNSLEYRRSLLKQHIVTPLPST